MNMLPILKIDRAPAILKNLDQNVFSITRTGGTSKTSQISI